MSVKRSGAQAQAFLGIDYTGDPGAVAQSRSPWAPNMIRSMPGKVRKCMGYHLLEQYPQRINGVHLLRGGSGEAAYTALVHAGTALYPEGESAPLYTGLADARSRSYPMGQALWLQDGANLLKISRGEDGSLSVQDARSIAYVPTLTISKDPKGGGESYEALNLLTPRFAEEFCGDGSSKTYYLTFSPLDETPLTVRVLNGTSGEWEDKTEGTDYTADRAAGTVSFYTAPPKSPNGEDNVHIEAGHTVEGYPERVLSCTTGILYGVNAMPDRLFAAGNPDYPNYDRWSGQNDPSYWPDTNYALLGSGVSAVTGYAVVDDCLAAYKDPMEPERCVILRRGTLNSDGDAQFAVTGTLQGPGVTAPWSLAYLENEPMALTPQGVYALTTSDITGQRYAQNRSRYADGALLHWQNPQECCAAVHGGIYWLCNGSEAYLLDGRQPVTDTQTSPYSTRLYAAFHRTNLPARLLWSDPRDGTLRFGTEQGGIWAFYTDADDPASYTDGDDPVGGETGACWTTPDCSGTLFYRRKCFCRAALRLGAASATGADVYAILNGQPKLLLSDHTTARFFDFAAVDFTRLCFSTDTMNRTLTVRTRIHGADKLRFRFANNAPREPFALMAYGFDRTER